MPKIKIDKHVVYTIIMNNLEWFETTRNKDDEYMFLTCYSIEQHINKYLEKEYGSKPGMDIRDIPFISLNASTLTAMVNDGVLERRHINTKRFSYRPYPYLFKDYCAEFYYMPQKLSAERD